jgi:hypothetical protein
MVKELMTVAGNPFRLITKSNKTKRNENITTKNKVEANLLLLVGH